MTNMAGFNQRREERTEMRIQGVLDILSAKPLYRHVLVERMSSQIGVGETTAKHIICAAMRFGKVEYNRGFYSVKK